MRREFYVLWGKQVFIHQNAIKFIGTNASFFPLRALKVCKSKEDLTIERTGKMSQANIDRK